MQAALKFSAPALESKRPALAVLGRAKLFELMNEDDDVLENLVDGGTVAGLELDDVQAMSLRELQEALRKERAERTKSDKAKQKVIDAKAAKITDMEVELARRDSAEPTEREQQQLDDVRSAGTGAEIAIRQLVGAAGAVLAAPASESAGTAARQACEFVAQVFAQLLAEHDVPVDFTELVTPHWLAATRAGKAAAKRA